MSALVTIGGFPVAGAPVTFTMVKSDGATMSQGATTGSNGAVTVRFSLKKSDPVGTYQGRDLATVSSLSGSSSTAFTVR
jgi:uncharacterized protein YfaS (alpha-2-macroglobulin family)